jgi:hypothetical protein
MSLRGALFFTLVLLVVPSIDAKDKKKVVLPDYVLKAKTVLIVINPDAGTSLQNPNANWIARQDVERAIMNWGRLELAMDPLTADLVISLRRGTGKMVSPTIGGPDNRPVIFDPSDHQRSYDQHTSSQHANWTRRRYVRSLSRARRVSLGQFRDLALHR